MMIGAKLIALERQRQVVEEGYPPKHDDTFHGGGDLSRAALAYLAFYDADDQGKETVPRHWWPWNTLDFKPGDGPTRNLVKAGALVSAEIDRLRRAAQAGPSAEMEDSIPKVVCLCGSTRFADTFQQENLRLTLEGYIVLTIGANVSDAALGIAQDSEQKAMLDELHLRKIDLADGIHVLNVGGYIGESTRQEVEYAQQNGKPITWLEEPA